MPNPEQSRLNGKKRLKGSKWKKTLEKEAARELVRQAINAHLEPMISAQVQHAQGISHFMLRGEDGKFERVTDPDRILDALNGGDVNAYYIFTKDPSAQAFKELLDRALDKPKEQAQDVNLNVSGDISAIIAEGRARAAARNKKS